MSKTIKINGNTYHITCNYHTRELKPLTAIPENVRTSWFDYVPIDENTPYDNRFFEYRGSWYDSQEFEVAGHDFKAMGFDGMQGQSYFDAIALQYFDKDGNPYDDYDSVVVAHIHW